MSLKHEKKVAFLTYKNFYLDFGSTLASKDSLSLTDTDNQVRKFLEENNVKCEPIAWDDNSIQLNDIDLFIIRSTWNYYHSVINLNRFLEFINNIGDKVCNFAKVINWNHNKIYLKDLKDRGIPIIPTIFIDINNLTLDYFINLNKLTKELIIKPSISGAGMHTYRINPYKITNQQFINIKKNIMLSGISKIMIQPYIDSITDVGEISLIFFRDKFSHAVRKIASSENCIIHSYVSNINYPPTEAINVAERSLFATYQILNLPKGSILYARVDLLLSNKNYLLSELELIEPDLFLQYSNNSIKSFGAAIIETLMLSSNESI